MKYKARYFHQSEFDSPDQPGSGCNINEDLVRALDYVRRELGQPLRINSGYRTEQHNKDVGGVSNSQHRLGNAADIHIDSQEMGDAIELLFIEFVGEKCGVGRYNTFCHVDVRGYLARWDNRAERFKHV